MKITALVLFIFFSLSCYAGIDPGTTPDSTLKSKMITRAQLARMIDSIFDLDEIPAKDIELLNYYASLLRDSKKDTVRIERFNLHDLSFYSRKDERALFPPVKIEEIPGNFNLSLENDYIGYYHPPILGVVTSNYGWREGKLHKGIDIDLRKGDKVKSAFAGKVRLAKYQGGFGNVVIIMHPNGLETVYAHLSRIKVKKGDVVRSGQIIGLGGNTGHSSGTHLHFEVRYKGHPLNPGAIISFTNNNLHYPSIVIKHKNLSLCAFPANCKLHKVSKGESWLAIAHKYGLTLKELMALNGIGRRYVLKAGQEVRIN
jgi:murein DD-endopeptidase MepM/ murein hydrolase activator NlpD